jgi:hypothetical protein
VLGCKQLYGGLECNVFLDEVAKTCAQQIVLAALL